MESSSQVSSTDGISPQPSPRMTRQDIPIPGFTDEQLVHVSIVVTHIHCTLTMEANLAVQNSRSTCTCMLTCVCDTIVEYSVHLLD